MTGCGRAADLHIGPSALPHFQSELCYTWRGGGAKGKEESTLLCNGIRNIPSQLLCARRTRIDLVIAREQPNKKYVLGNGYTRREVSAPRSYSVTRIDEEGGGV